jgi:hypothetical protein
MLWAPVDLCSYSRSGRTFFPGPRTPQSNSRDWAPTTVRSVTRAPSESPLSVYTSHGQICAVVSATRLRPNQVRPPQAVPGPETLPDFIALPRDASGRPIIPKSRVAALVEAQRSGPACYAQELYTFPAENHQESPFMGGRPGGRARSLQSG